MRRRSFLASSLGIPALAGSQGRRPNLVLITADDLGWPHLCSYGADLHETPNLDRLATEGVRFGRAYSASPVCSPTRASIHTGQSPARLGLTIWREASQTPPQNRLLIPPKVAADLPHSATNLARVLAEAGYFNAHIGKWHLGGASHYPESQGFHLNIGGSLWGAPQSYFDPYTGTAHYGGEFRYVPGLPFGKKGEYLPDRLTSETLAVLDRVHTQPFFLNLNYHIPHTPIEAKPELVEHYRKKLRPEHRLRNPVYAAMVHSLDENVGRVLAHLDKLGVRDNTAVIFLSDNGGLVGSHQGQIVSNNLPLRSGKGSLYEGGIRVPLIARWPGVTASGAVCNEPVVSTDLYATLLAAAGQPHAAGLDAQSLLPVLRNPGGRLDRSELVFHYPHYYATTSPVSALLERDWKLIHHYEDGRSELYNLSEDPGETDDRAGALSSRATRMRERLLSQLKAVNAPMPVRREG
jgi:arylsulfatase A